MSINIPKNLKLVNRRAPGNYKENELCNVCGNYIPCDQFVYELNEEGNTQEYSRYNYKMHKECYEIYKKENEVTAETRCEKCSGFVKVKIVGNKIEGQCEKCHARLRIG
jgi:hypothetical protein